MSTASTATEPKNATSLPLLPPEETFWKRYSPHNEAPLSGVSSTVLHVLMILLLLGIIAMQNALKLDDEFRPPPVDPVRLNLGGGGGSPSGSGGGPGGTGQEGDQ